MVTECSMHNLQVGCSLVYCMYLCAGGAPSLLDPYLVERGCDTSIVTTRRKSCEETTLSTGETVMSCSCFGDQCNAYGMTLLEGRLLILGTSMDQCSNLAIHYCRGLTECQEVELCWFCFHSFPCL